MRLRDEVRSAAEREALEIVTAARRDVRRIVVDARRELLVLTAQLHAAIESVDQASLQAAAETASGADHGPSVTDVLTGQRSLGETQDLVLGARREVRSVLDEARAEIEALVAEANGPLREIPAALGGTSHGAEPPIPTLETILGADPLARRSDARPETFPRSEPGPIPDSLAREDGDQRRGTDAGGSRSGPWRPSIEARAPSSTPEIGRAHV